MSDIALGHQVAAATGTDATTHTTASFAPTAAGNLVLIVNHHTHGTAATSMTAPTGASITSMVQVASNAISATRSQDIWLGVTTASTSTVVFHYNETATGAIWTIQEFLNVDVTRGLNNLIGGLVANLAQNSGSGTTFSTAMPYHIQHPANAFVSIWGFDVTSHDTSPEAGWTEIDDQTIATPTTIGQSIDWRIGEDLTPTATYGASTTWIGYSLELWGADANGDWAALETFTKADDAGWGDDQAWSTLSHGTPVTHSNQATAFTVNIYADNFFANDSSSQNHEARVQAAIMTLSSQSAIGVRLRCHTSTTEAYEFVRIGASTLGAFSVVLRYRNTVGAYTTLAGPTVIGRAALTTLEQLYFIANGSTLTCFLNGTQVLAVTDTRLTGRNRGGLVVRVSADSDTRADNFQFGDIGQTASPKALASTGATTASKAKASLTKKWVSTAKSATADQAKAVLSSRFARFTARSGTASSARATVFGTQVEGFTVARKLIAKAPTASSAKATITANQKKFAAKVPTASASGLTFHPVFMDVKKGQQGSSFPNASNVTASLSRGVGEATKVFQAQNITAHFAGGISHLTVKIPIVSNLVVHSPIFFTATVPIVSSARATEWTLPPGIGGFFTCPNNDSENPTTCAHKEVGDRLFRHYRPRPVGRNVYLWSDGTVSESDPDGYSHIWREADRTGDTLVDAAHVLRVFWGGHDGEQVSSAEATLLVAAGYTVRGFHA